MSLKAAPFLPSLIRSGLCSGTILVFGSNLEGRHGAGSALAARLHFGARYGVGEGRTGHCYALPTKRTPYERMTIQELRTHVDRFLEHAREHTTNSFVLVEIGCRLAGFTVAEVAPLFRAALDMPNVFLPHSFLQQLGALPRAAGL